MSHCEFKLIKSFNGCSTYNYIKFGRINKIKNITSHQVGNIVVFNDGVYNLVVKVVDITSNQKIKIQAMEDIDNIFNTSTVVNVYRKHIKSNN